jgi:hypothetical protein
LPEGSAGYEIQRRNQAGPQKSGLAFPCDVQAQHLTTEVELDRNILFDRCFGARFEE